MRCARERDGMCGRRAVVGGADAGVVPASTSGRSSPRAAVARLMRDHVVNGCALCTAIGSGRDQPQERAVLRRPFWRSRTTRVCWTGEALLCDATQSTVCESGMLSIGPWASLDQRFTSVDVKGMPDGIGEVDPE